MRCPFQQGATSAWTLQLFPHSPVGLCRSLAQLERGGYSPSTHLTARAPLGPGIPVCCQCEGDFWIRSRIVSIPVPKQILLRAFVQPHPPVPRFVSRPHSFSEIEEPRSTGCVENADNNGCSE